MAPRWPPTGTGPTRSTPGTSSTARSRAATSATTGCAAWSFATTVVNGGLTAADLAAGSVGTSEVAAGAIGNEELLSGAVRSDSVLNESLTGDDILNESLNGGEIANATLGPAKIIGDSLTANSLATNSVGWLEVSSSTFDSEEIASTGNQNFAIPNAAIDAGELGPGAVPADGVGDDGSTKLATDSVDFDEVAASAIRSAQVQNDSLTGNDVNESTLAPSIDARSASAAQGYFESIEWASTSEVILLTEPVSAGTYAVFAELGVSNFDEDTARCYLRSPTAIIDEVTANTRGSSRLHLGMSGVVQAAGNVNLTISCRDVNGSLSDPYFANSPDLIAIPLDTAG